MVRLSSVGQHWIQLQLLMTDTDQGIESLLTQCFLVKWLKFQMCKFQTHLEDRYLECSTKHDPGINAGDPVNCTSTLTQVMTWFRQATSHYRNQYGAISPTSYILTGPQWVNLPIAPWVKNQHRIDSVWYMALYLQWRFQRPVSIC